MFQPSTTSTPSTINLTAVTNQSQDFLSKAKNVLDSALVRAVIAVAFMWLTGSMLFFIGGLFYLFFDQKNILHELSIVALHIWYPLPSMERYNKTSNKNWTFYEEIPSSINHFLPHMMQGNALIDPVATHGDSTLYIGALPLEKHVNWLEQKQCRYVVSLVEYSEYKAPPFLNLIKPAKWIEKEIHFRHIPCQDLQPLSATQIREIVAIAQQAFQNNESIYIHCKAGRARSAIAAIATIAQLAHLNLQQAYEHVKKARSQISVSAAELAPVVEFLQSNA